MNKPSRISGSKKADINSAKIMLHNEVGAIDLSSIMVGIIVIGLIGGVIAATIFALIPWTQDNAAKQQLGSIVSAESAYMGLSSATPLALPSGSVANSFGSSEQLQKANLMSAGASYCVTASADGKTYTAYSQSASGNVYTTTDQNSNPVETITVPASCVSILNSVAHSKAVPAIYVDPNPQLTTFTYLCDTTTTGYLPIYSNVTGTETWNDGVTNTYNGVGTGIQRTLNAGVTYTVSFQGTYNKMAGFISGYNSCLRSVDHWGDASGITDASDAFNNSINLVAVPEHIPSTITNMTGMFRNASNINDPNISKWNVGNVINMDHMFYNTALFNQPLDSWNVSKVINMNSMLAYTRNFNQPLNDWNVSQVTNLSGTFMQAFVFNQPLDKWDTSKVADMSMTFWGAYNYGQDLSGWKVGSVTTHSGFSDMTAFTAAQLPKFLN